MKHIILFVTTAFISISALAQSDSVQYFGKEITQESPTAPADFLSTVQQQGEITTQVAGEITKVCPMKGCWMTMEVAGQEMMVRFKDYGFFVPKDAAGKTAVVQGQAVMDTLDVATLRDYAEDAGKSAEEINAITEPEVKLSFTADGVILKE